MSDQQSPAIEELKALIAKHDSNPETKKDLLRVIDLVTAQVEELLTVYALRSKRLQGGSDAP